MGRTRTAELKLDIEIKRANVQQANKNIDTLEKKLKDAEKAGKRLGGNVEKELNQVRKAANKAAKEVNQLEKELDQASKARLGATGDIAGGFGAVSTFAGSAGLGPLGDITAFIDDFINLGEQLPKAAGGAKELAGAAGGAGTATSGLGALMGPLTVGLGAAAIGLAIIIDQLKKISEEGSKQVQAAVSEQRTFQDAIRLETRESVEARLEGLRLEREAAQATRDVVRDAVNAQKEAHPFFVFLADIFGQISEPVDELNDELRAMNAEINGLEKALEDSRLQTDATKQATADYSDTLAQQERAQEQARRAEEEMRRKIEQAQEEARRRREEAAREEQRRMEQINREREAAAKKAADNAKKRADIEQKFNDSLVDMARDRVLAEQELFRQLEEDLRSLDVEAGQARFDAILESQRDEERAARDHARTLQQIRRDAERAEEDAARDRDFAALAEIRRNTGEQLKDAEEGFKVERKERQIALNQLFQDIKRDLDRQRQERRRAARLERQDLRRDFAERERELRLNRTRQMRDLQSAINQELNIRRSGYVAALKMTGDFVNQIQKQFGALSGAGGGMVGVGSTQTSTTSRRLGTKDDPPVTQSQMKTIMRGFSGT